MLSSSPGALVPDVDDGLSQRGACFDGLSIGLEVPLRGNQLHQLFRQVYIRPLQRPAWTDPKPSPPASPRVGSPEFVVSR